LLELLSQKGSLDLSGIAPFSIALARFCVLYLLMRQIAPYFAQVEKAFSLRHVAEKIGAS